MNGASTLFIRMRRTFIACNTTVITMAELNFESAVAVPAITPFIKKNFAEVEAFAACFPRTATMSYEHPTLGLVTFQERKMQWAAPDFLEMFDSNWLRAIGQHAWMA